MQGVRVPFLSVYWTRQAFVHWPYPPAVIQSLLPPHLEADVFAGQGWVSMTPFLMSRTQVLGVPMPRGTFPETNLRTYVRHGGGPSGLWFLALDVTHPAMLTARLLGIPYSRARLVVEEHGGTCHYAGSTRAPRPPIRPRSADRSAHPSAPPAGLVADRPLPRVLGIRRRAMADTGRPRALAALHRSRRALGGVPAVRRGIAR